MNSELSLSCQVGQDCWRMRHRTGSYLGEQVRKLIVSPDVVIDNRAIRTPDFFNSAMRRSCKHPDDPTGCFPTAKPNVQHQLKALAAAAAPLPEVLGGEAGAAHAHPALVGALLEEA